jgi:hypothetical protein
VRASVAGAVRSGVGEGFSEVVDLLLLPAMTCLNSATVSRMAVARMRGPALEL